jgi:hypothetical protein
MKRGRVTAVVVAWAASIGVGYLVNEVLFKGLYMAQPAGVFRPDAELMAKLPLGIAFQLLGFFAFARAYGKGYEGGSGIAEGLRFGLLIGVMLDCFATAWFYVTSPISMTMMLAMMVDNLVEASIYGAIVGALYHPAAKSIVRPATAL